MLYALSKPPRKDLRWKLKAETGMLKRGRILAYGQLASAVFLDLID